VMFFRIEAIEQSHLALDTRRK